MIGKFAIGDRREKQGRKGRSSLESGEREEARKWGGSLIIYGFTNIATRVKLLQKK